jgi:hypothetical protein
VLRRLSEDGYLHRLPRRVGGAGSGSAGFVYCLGYRGQRLVFPTLFPGRRARTPEEVGTSFVRHSLAVAELVVALVVSERDGGCSDLVLETEPSVWRDYLGTNGAKRSLRPDLGVRLSVSGQQLVWFVEVDRGTEGLRRIRAKGAAVPGVLAHRPGAAAARWGLPQGALVGARPAAPRAAAALAWGAAATCGRDVRRKHG